MNGRQVTRWLPRDERRLLAYYFTKLKRPKDFEIFRDPMELMKVLGYHLKRTTEAQNSPFLLRVIDANDNLKDRGLAKIQQEPTGMDVTVSLTLEGWDLGRKYNHWFTMTGLWWAEYKSHWIWSIVTAILTFFIGWLVGMLTK